MVKRKESSGITLIALIITIIVLLILAGVSISLVLGDNGTVTKTMIAKEKTNKAEAKERIELEVSGSYDDTGTINIDDLNKNLRDNLSGVKLKVQSDDENISDGDFQELSEENKIKRLPAIVQYKGYDMTIGKHGKVEIAGETSELSTLDIGSYVDIEITYENVMDFTSGYSDTSSKLTGWRILDNTGNEIKVISAGCPLAYYHDFSSINVTDSLNKLKDLYTTIEEGNSAGQFPKNGFSDNNLKTVFDSSPYIDATKGVHAFSCSTSYNISGVQVDPKPEVETLYQKITGTNKTMTNLYNSNAFQTSTIKTTEGVQWKDSYSDLFGIGQYYWLGGASCNDDCLWFVSNISKVLISNNSISMGVRPVVSLKSDVKVDKSQDRDGKSAKTAYKLTQ